MYLVVLQNDFIFRGLDFMGLIENTLLTQYCEGDKIEKNEMGWVCDAYGWGEGGV